MPLRRTKLLDIKSVTGIATVGIFTVGVTDTAVSAVGIASTTYLRSVVMHNTGVSTCTSSFYVYPNQTTVVTGIGVTANRLARVDLASNETFFLEFNYPLVLKDRDAVVVEVTSSPTGSTGINTVNYQLIGDTDK